MPIKLPGDSPFAGASFSLRPAHVLSSASLSQSTHFLVWVNDLILMASTCSQSIAHIYPHSSTVKPSFRFSNPLSSLDMSLFGCAARLNLSAMDVPASMNGRRFQASPAVGQPLPPACVAEPSEDGEIFDSYDDDLPSVRRILASSKQVIDLTRDDDGDPPSVKQILALSKQVIDLTCDDDGDSKSDDGNHTEISWLTYTRAARYRVTLTSPSLTDRFRVADQFSLSLTVLPTKFTSTHRQRPPNVIYSGHTWQEETPLDQCSSVVPIAPQTSTALRQVS
jgi:hypothetical protein